ncbi:hypothetical protein CC117_28985 [Parafrankia colletiae]|uniref:Uncharacterized protein n=1 Tax=Parafrankia colletiae TaxID=573497 RepID=A0A1S1Q6N2_9ACTN|nr:hypothetical protein [Parafrankia colletiae]MCK9903632.1 hypothetical protein [Frankia sp. Cpl3]OHV29600.1 hypothetical protein CC117_28985 [Parafrankia colletiae]
MTTPFTLVQPSDGDGTEPEPGPEPASEAAAGAARAGERWFALPWALAGAVVPALLVLWDIKAYDRAFDHGLGRGAVTLAFAALLGALLVLAVHRVYPDDAALAMAAALGAVLTMGFLNRERFLPSFWPFLSVAVGTAAMLAAALLAAGRWRWPDPWARPGRARQPPGRSLTPLLVLLTLLTVAVLGLTAPWTEPLSSGPLGAAPAELLRYLLFALVAALLPARTAQRGHAGHTERDGPDDTGADDDTGGGDDDTGADDNGDDDGNGGGDGGDGSRVRPWVTGVAWAVAAPLGLLLATADVASAALLAIGLLTVLAARRLWAAAAAVAVVTGGGGLAWCVVAVGVLDEERRAAGLPDLTDRGWHDDIWDRFRLIDAGWTGPTPTGLLPAHGSWSDRELPLVGLVEQYGVTFAVFAGLAVATLVALLVWLVARAPLSPVRAVSAGLVAMLAAGLALPGLVLLTDAPRLGTAVPLLSGGGTSLILALTSVGLALGAAARAGGGRDAGRPVSFGGFAVSRPGAVLTAGAVAAVTAAVTLAPLAGAHGDVTLVHSADGRVVGLTDRGTDPGQPQLVPELAAVADLPLPPDAESVTLDWRIQHIAENALGDHRGALVVLELPRTEGDGEPAHLRAAVTTRRPVGAAAGGAPDGGITAEHPASGLVRLLYHARSETSAAERQDYPRVAGSPAPPLAPGAEKVLLDCVPPSEDPRVSDGFATTAEAAAGASRESAGVPAQDCQGGGTLSLSVLDASVLAAVLLEQGGEPGTSPVPCPVLVPGLRCTSGPYQGLRPEVVKELYAGMSERGLAEVEDGSVRYDTFRDGKVTWLIGGVESGGRRWSFGMAIEGPRPSTIAAVGGIVTALAAVGSE